MIETALLFLKDNLLHFSLLSVFVYLVHKYKNVETRKIKEQVNLYVPVYYLIMMLFFFFAKDFFLTTAALGIFFFIYIIRHAGIGRKTGEYSKVGEKLKEENKKDSDKNKRFWNNIKNSIKNSIIVYKERIKQHIRDISSDPALLHIYFLMFLIIVLNLAITNIYFGDISSNGFFKLITDYITNWINIIFSYI